MGKKISQLPSASLPLSGNEMIPLVQGGVTKKTPSNTLLKAKSISVKSIDFVGSIYQNNLLKTLSADVDFWVFSDEGSGVLLKVGDGYTFDTVQGALNTSVGDYRILIF